MERTPYHDILRKGFDEFRDFINPMIAQRAQLAGEPVQVTEVKEGCLVDLNGQQIEDFHGVQGLGHRHPRIAEAIKQFLESPHPSWYPSRVNPFVGRLGKVLQERTGYDNAFFALSGSEAVEAALKLSRVYSGKHRILGMEYAYHGCTFGSCGLMHKGMFRDPFAPHLPGLSSLPREDVDALEKELSKGDVAAVILEPIQVEGGMHIFSEGYISALCELTKKHDVLLIADEVQTGLGRAGTHLLSSNNWPRKPDVALLGKTLGGGLLPVSAMLTSKDIFLRAYGGNVAFGEAHNTTFSNNALGCVAALETLEILDQEMIDSIGEKGRYFLDTLKEHLEDHPLVDSIRGRGLMIGIDLNPLEHPWLSYEHFGMSELSGKPLEGPLICHRMYKRNFFIFSCGHQWSTLRIQPRFTISKETLLTFVKYLREELDALAELV